MSGPPPTTTQNQTQTHTPWDQATPYLTGIMQSAQDLYKQGGNTAGQAALGQLATDTASGKYLTAGQNYIKDMIPGLTQQLTQTLNGQRDQSQANGAFGGDRAQLAQGAAVGDFSSNLAGLYAQQYAQERQLQQNAGTLLGQQQGLQWGPLMNYANIINQTSQPYGTTTGTSTGTQTAGGNQWMAAAATAAQIASLFI